jgi:hypothetical protein
MNTGIIRGRKEIRRGVRMIRGVRRKRGVRMIRGVRRKRGVRI